MKWIALEERKPMAGIYLVGAYPKSVAQARYMPKAQKWVFPSAQMRFEPTHWQYMPDAPQAPCSFNTTKE